MAIVNRWLTIAAVFLFAITLYSMGAVILGSLGIGIHLTR